MPTEEELWRQVRAFEREYPDSLPERLTWWRSKLGFDLVRLLRLLGLTTAAARRTSESDLERIVSQREERAEQIDDMLRHILASYDYNVPWMSEAFHRAAESGVEAASLETRRRNEAVRLPYRVGPKQRMGLLLNEVVGGGPNAYSALQAYLTDPGTGA